MPKREKNAPKKNELFGFVFPSFKKTCQDAKGGKFSWCLPGNAGMSGLGSQMGDRGDRLGQGEEGRPGRGQGSGPGGPASTREAQAQGGGTLAAHGSETQWQQEVGAVEKLGRKKWQ